MCLEEKFQIGYFSGHPVVPVITYKSGDIQRTGFSREPFCKEMMRRRGKNEQNIAKKISGIMCKLKLGHAFPVTKLSTTRAPVAWEKF